MLSYEEFKKKLTGQVRGMLPEKYRDVCRETDNTLSRRRNIGQNEGGKFYDI